MKAFDANPQCEKCLSKDMGRQYHDANKDWSWCGLFPSKLPVLKVEHHFMTCRDCGFMWQEMVAGKLPPTVFNGPPTEKL